MAPMKPGQRRSSLGSSNASDAVGAENLIKV